MNEDPDFWRQLAQEFLSFPPIRAHWTKTEGSGTLKDWSLEIGSVSTRLQFTSLAKRAALGLSACGNTDLLGYWLEEVYQEFPDTSVALGSQNIRGVQLHNEAGSISNAGERSANLCMMLENQALDLQAIPIVDPVEFVRNVTDEPVVPTQPTEPTTQKITPSYGKQIERLRQECRWTIEQLAEKVRVNRRTVQRHLADETIPYDRHIFAYEETFSKFLNRKVVIKKMP